MPPIAESMRLQSGVFPSYPTDHEALVSIENRVPAEVPKATSSVPPKPSSNGSSSPRSTGQTMRKSTSTRKLDPPYALERSSSSSRLRRASSPAGDLRSRLTRSLSSSSVNSCGSASEQSPRYRDLNSLMSNLNMRRQKYGEEHPKVGSCWNKLGNAYFAASQYSYALDSYKHAVACYQTDEAELACTYGNMGTAYWASGRPDKAIQFLNKALDVYEYHDVADGRNPEESLPVASTLYQMGLCFCLLKEYSEALTCLKKCQKIQSRTFGPMDMSLGRTLDAIGKVHYFRGDYAMALNCHEEARRIKSAFGDTESATVLQSLLNIAAVHSAKKNWNAALNKYTKVMHLQKAALVRCRNRNGQPFLARAAQELGETLHLMGHIYRQMDKEEQAKQYFKEALSCYEEAGVVDEDPRVAALK